MTDDDLNAIRKRLEAATPGPWIEGYEEYVYGDGDESYENWVEDEKGGRVASTCGFSDTDLIAHAPSDIAALLAEVERLREVVQNKNAWLKFAAGCGPIPAGT